MGIAQDFAKAWCISFNHYDPADEGRRESLLALGNGGVVSRAAAPESKADTIHYPGTYRVGCYNEVTSHIQGQEVKNESMVNLPNWLPVTFWIKGGDWFSLDQVTILAYEQTLHLHQGLLTRKVHFSDQQSNQTLLQERRFVSMHQPHLMALTLEITAENWSGELEICSGLDGNIKNTEVRRYAPFNSHHLEIISTNGWAEEGIELLAQTTQSRITIALAARTQVQVKSRKAPITAEVKSGQNEVFNYQRLLLSRKLLQ